MKIVTLSDYAQVGHLTKLFLLAVKVM